MMTYKEKIKELRTEKNLSQMELANATGISQSAIAKWELGKAEPTATNIITMANYFEVSTDYLLGREDY